MEITKTQEAATLTVALAGRITTNTAGEVGEALEDLSGVERLVLDFAGVEFISSAGLRVLLVAQKAMMASGGAMVLKNVNDDVMDVFDVTGFADILTIEE